MVKRGKGKKGLTLETLIPWMIAVAVLVLVTTLYLILSGKGTGAIEYIKNLMRFGR